MSSLEMFSKERTSRFYLSYVSMAVMCVHERNFEGKGFMFPGRRSCPVYYIFFVQFGDFLVVLNGRQSAIGVFYRLCEVNRWWGGGAYGLGDGYSSCVQMIPMLLCWFGWDCVRRRLGGRL